MPSFVSTQADMVVSGVLPIDQMRDFVPPVTLISFLCDAAISFSLHCYYRNYD